MKRFGGLENLYKAVGYLSDEEMGDVRRANIVRFQSLKKINADVPIGQRWTERNLVKGKPQFRCRRPRPENFKRRRDD
jgi:hypothetical protein